MGLRWRDCVECGERSRNAGRGLCAHCHQGALRAGTLCDYERLTRSRADVLDDWTVLRGQGVTRLQAAARLGMSFPAFERALFRARAAGDERAVLGVRT